MEEEEGSEGDSVGRRAPKPSLPSQLLIVWGEEREECMVGRLVRVGNLERESGE